MKSRKLHKRARKLWVKSSRRVRFSTQRLQPKVHGGVKCRMQKFKGLPSKTPPRLAHFRRKTKEGPTADSRVWLSQCPQHQNTQSEETASSTMTASLLQGSAKPASNFFYRSCSSLELCAFKAQTSSHHRPGLLAVCADPFTHESYSNYSFNQSERGSPQGIPRKLCRKRKFTKAACQEQCSTRHEHGSKEFLKLEKFGVGDFGTVDRCTEWLVGCVMQ